LDWNLDQMTGKQPKRKPRPGVDEYGRTPLHYAANDGNASLCVDLLTAGADPNATDDNGWTPLHFAAQVQSAEVTRLLLDAAAKTELRDSYGNTPLWRATVTARGNGDVIALLRRAGADPYAKNNYGNSPISIARETPTAQFFADLPKGR
jgi:ankyrin repeat protein